MNFQLINGHPYINNLYNKQFENKIYFENIS